MNQVVLYTKQTCPLCDEAKELLYKLQAEIPFDLKEKDIYQDDRLLEKYQLMIPVIEANGKIVIFGKIEENSLRKRLLELVSVD